MFLCPQHSYQNPNLQCNVFHRGFGRQLCLDGVLRMEPSNKGISVLFRKTRKDKSNCFLWPPPFSLPVSFPLSLTFSFPPPKPTPCEVTLMGSSWGIKPTGSLILNFLVLTPWDINLMFKPPVSNLAWLRSKLVETELLKSYCSDSTRAIYINCQLRC